MDFECTDAEFFEVRYLLSRHMPAYSLRTSRGVVSAHDASEGFSWITAGAAAELFAHSSARRTAAILRRGGIPSTKIGSRVFYERAAVNRLEYQLCETLSMADASRHVGFSSARGLRPYVANGRIKATKVAGLIRFEWDEIERFMGPRLP